MDDLDLVADLNAQDDDGFGWSTLSDAAVPGRVRPGAMLLAGDDQAQAGLRVGGRGDDRARHFSVVPPSEGLKSHPLPPIKVAVGGPEAKAPGLWSVWEQDWR